MNSDKRISQKQLDRLQQIVQRVKQAGFASVEELAEYFSVTSQTIRRDIARLCDDGVLRRYHGGAAPAASGQNVDYSDRKSLYQPQKQIIAQLVASYIPDNASLFINIGTTTEEVANALMEHKGLRIITNNLNLANAFSHNDNFEVIIAGGVVRPRDRGVTGEATIDFIKQFKVDYGIIGISGIDPDGSLLDFDYHEVRVSQAILENSRETLLAADYSKVGRNAMVRLGHLSQVDHWFTDRAPPEIIQDVISQDSVRVHYPKDKS